MNNGTFIPPPSNNYYQRMPPPAPQHPPYQHFNNAKQPMMYRPPPPVAMPSIVTHPQSNTAGITTQGQTAILPWANKEAHTGREFQPPVDLEFLKQKCGYPPHIYTFLWQSVDPREWDFKNYFSPSLLLFLNKGLGHERFNSQTHMNEQRPILIPSYTGQRGVCVEGPVTKIVRQDGTALPTLQPYSNGNGNTTTNANTTTPQKPLLTADMLLATGSVVAPNLFGQGVQYPPTPYPSPYPPPFVMPNSAFPNMSYSPVVPQQQYGKSKHHHHSHNHQHQSPQQPYWMTQQYGSDAAVTSQQQSQLQPPAMMYYPQQPYYGPGNNNAMTPYNNDPDLLRQLNMTKRLARLQNDEAAKKAADACKLMVTQVQLE